MTADTFLTFSQVSLKLQVPEHILRRAARLGLLPLGKAGRCSFVRADALDAVRQALVEAELIPTPSVAGPTPLPMPSV